MKPVKRSSISAARRLAVLFSALLLLAPLGSALALDTVDTAHPGVGTMVTESNTPTGSVFSKACSGTLIAPQVFLTAGHCTRGVQRWLDSGVIQFVYVSFDATITQNATLLAVSELVTHPDYGTLPANDSNDLGVVLLAEPATGIPVTPLPVEGLLDSLRLEPGTPVTALGYGRMSNDVHGTPSFTLKDFRASGILSYRALTKANVTVTQLANQGSDNICFGDSGGPDFVQVDGQEQLVAINVELNSYSCEEVAWLYRLDTPQARGFLGQYVDLP